MRTVPLLLPLLVLLGGGCARKKAPEKILEKAAAKAPAGPPLTERGAAVYAKLCATCHGVGANGYVADNAPSLRTSTFLASATDAFLRAGISRGRPGTAMAGYGREVGGPLAPDEVNAVIAFLRMGGPVPVVLPPRPIAGDKKRGEAVYAVSCVRCHGTPTQRSTAIHLANPILLETASDAFLRWAVENGRSPTSMVAWKGTLSPQQIDDVIAYVRSLAVPPAVPSPPPSAVTGASPRAPRQGPVVLNPKGRRPHFVLKDDRFVSIDQVKEALDKKQRIVIADARAPSDYLNLHIAGAISTPYYDAKSLDDIPNDGTWVVAYCACPHHVSGEVVDALRKRGYKNTAVIDEGVFAWQQKNYPIVAAPGTQPPPAPPPPRPDPAAAKH